jgi:hypothetical protein
MFLLFIVAILSCTPIVVEVEGIWISTSNKFSGIKKFDAEGFDQMLGLMTILFGLWLLLLLYNFVFPGFETCDSFELECQSSGNKSKSCKSELDELVELEVNLGE